MEFASWLDLITALNREGVRYKVIGGVATNLHGIPRATEDADFLVDPAPQNVQRLKRALRVWSNDASIDAISDDALRGEYPFLTYKSPDASFCVNIMSALPRSIAYEAVDSETHDVKGMPVHVVTAPALYDMKRTTNRHDDTIDAINLATPFEFAEAPNAGL